MNIAQAADGMVNRVMKQHLPDIVKNPGKFYNKVFEVMAAVW
jgi:hypothetical protein